LIVKKANEHDIVIIPFGGGTNVTQALVPYESEKRIIISLDMTRMNHVKWVDRKNRLACIEAGITGKDLEKELRKYGMVFGHEPDSYEFSTLGGWISTKASGMKKNKYGNIEDILVSSTIVTSIGTIVQDNTPRVSAGPSIT